MQQVTANYGEKASAIHKKPIYVLEIIWADGTEGTEGTNDVYFATDAVSKIDNFPYPNVWFPILDNDIGAITHKLDAINGVSTIGSMTFNILDVDKIASNIIKAANDAGHGLRRQRCELYLMYEGLDWVLDRVKVRTLKIDNLRLNTRTNRNMLSAADSQKDLKIKAFEGISTYVAAATSYPASGTPVLPAISGGTTGFEAVVNANAAGTALETFGYIKVEDEVLQHSGISGDNFVITARAQFGTVAAAHSTVGSTDSRGMEITEIPYVRGNPVDIALKLFGAGMPAGEITAENTEYANVYPDHWGLGLTISSDPDDHADVRLDMWLEFGYQHTALNGLVAAHAWSGMQYEFAFTKGVETKKFIELEMLKFLGGFQFVDGNGSLGIKAYSNSSGNNPSTNTVDASGKVTTDFSTGTTIATLTNDDVVSWGVLDYKYNDMINVFGFSYQLQNPLASELKRTILLVDADSRNLNGATKSLSFNCKGLVPLRRHVESNLARFIYVATRLSRPPLRIKVTALSKWHTLEVGDAITLALPDVWDALAGTWLNRAFEIQSTSLDLRSGKVVLDLLVLPDPIALENLTESFINNTALRTDDVAYTSNGAALPNVISVNTTIGTVGVKTDYHVTGDFTINAGVTLTAQGSVRLFITGDYYPKGDIDGKGLGTATNNSPLSTSPDVGFIGIGGKAYANPVQKPPYHSSVPLIQPMQGSIDPITEKWTTFTGVPTAPMYGNSGNASSVSEGETGGAGGSSLAVFARGVDMTISGTADFSGIDGGDFITTIGDFFIPQVTGGGGGGGGGNYIIMIENNGVAYTYVIDKTGVLTNGGARGGVQHIGNKDRNRTFRSQSTDGSSGAIIFGVW